MSSSVQNSFEEISNIKNRRSGTFTDNMKLPIHRWFRYSAGFSAEWVNTVIEEIHPEKVLDPFAGSGTVCISCDRLGVQSIGVEAHPFVFNIAHAKSLWFEDHKCFLDTANELLSHAKKCTPEKKLFENPLIAKCYSQEVLTDLLKLKNAFNNLSCKKNIKELLFIAISSILRKSSHVGTAQWQYILPNKIKSKIISPYDAFIEQINIMYDDIHSMSLLKNSKPLCKIICEDSRTLQSIDSSSIDLVITSPPYANNYDYADATRLEMTFWGDVTSWGDLHDAVRKYLICSNAQHASKEKFNLEELVESIWLKPIYKDILLVCNELSLVRETKGGKKNYHTMLAAYFIDMAKTFFALRRVMRPYSKLCFVIGDSAPYGVYAPVDLWLGKLALAAGFRSWEFEKLRDRNIKWKNRKHSVPLKEGRLWITG